MTPRTYLLVTIDSVRGRHIARSYLPPNGARQDWEFGRETYVEALTTVLNTLAADGWKLASIDTSDNRSTYVMVKES